MLSYKVALSQETGRAVNALPSEGSREPGPAMTCLRGHREPASQGLPRLLIPQARAGPCLAWQPLVPLPPACPPSFPPGSSAGRGQSQPLRPPRLLTQQSPTHDGLSQRRLTVRSPVIRRGRLLPPLCHLPPVSAVPWCPTQVAPPLRSCVTLTNSVAERLSNQGAVPLSESRGRIK